MKLSTRQADALKSWCKDAVIQYAAKKARSQIGAAATVKALCSRGLVTRDKGVDAPYRLTSLGVDELRHRGFFTRPPGAVIEFE